MNCSCTYSFIWGSTEAAHGGSQGLVLALCSRVPFWEYSGNDYVTPGIGVGT